MVFQAPQKVVYAGVLMAMALVLSATGCFTYRHSVPESLEVSRQFASIAKVSTPASVSRLRVVSYNIALGYGLDAPKQTLMRLSRDGYSIRAALKKHPDLKGFDILGVQELCSNRGGAQIESLQKLYPGYAMYFGRADLERVSECAKGQAILSRHPIESAGTLHLPQIRRIGRSAVWANIRVPAPDGGEGTLVRVYNIHLDNRGDSMFAAEGRWVQMQAILKEIETWRLNHPYGEVILLGDFNSLGELYNPWRGERTIVEIQKQYNSVIPEYESTHVLSYQLDWIFYPKSSSLRLRRSAVVGLLRSDHFPVVADFDLYHIPKTATARQPE